MTGQCQSVPHEPRRTPCPTLPGAGSRSKVPPGLDLGGVGFIPVSPVGAFFAHLCLPNTWLIV